MKGASAGCRDRVGGVESVSCLCGCMCFFLYAPDGNWEMENGSHGDDCGFERNFRGLGLGLEPLETEVSSIMMHLGIEKEAKLCSSFYLAVGSH